MSPTATEHAPPPEAAEEIFDELDHNPPTKPIWDGSEGFAVTAFGIVVPALVTIAASVVFFERLLRLIFKHPVETLVECAFVALIPIANYLAWNALRRNDFRHPLLMGILNGSAITTSFALSAITGASVFFGMPGGYLLFAAASGVAGFASLYIGWSLRNAVGTRQGQANRVLFSALGALLAMLGLAACEAKGTMTRFAESMALSDVPADRDRALDMLRKLDVEQDLRMQCADGRIAGLPGMFWRISPERERELYFAVTGKPYGNNLTDSVYSMSDEYLSKHVVGAPTPGLNLLRSQLAGYVNPRTLTSTVTWTFVFKNNTFQGQEARAEIAVPPGAMISDLMMWKDGTARKAMIGPGDRVFAMRNQDSRMSKYNWYDMGDVDPALITDLGRGRALLKCADVPAQGEVKVQLTFTERLKPVELTQANMVLPHFVDANFSLKGDYNLRLHSPKPMSVPAEMKTIRLQSAADGGALLIGSLDERDLNGATFNVGVTRAPEFGPFAIAENKGASQAFIKETIKRVGTNAPEHLVVVVDNSQSMKGHVDELIKALENMPPNVKASIVLPTDGQQMEPVELKKGIQMLRTAKFTGGKDNLQAVIKAAESAGETRHGAVLWVHGPQPSFNEEMYIMAPYIERPSFYELALDDRWTDTNEFFKNHREIGPFVAVARAAGVMDDLRSFISKWQTGGSEFVVSTERSTDRPDCEQVTGRAAEELSRICARDEVYKVLRDGDLSLAAEMATQAHIVTPVTSGAVLHRTQVAQQVNEVQQTAWIQGATNGTIGPRDYEQHVESQVANQPANLAVGSGASDAGLIAGVNTAATVRVNNLASLESLLGIIAIGIELIGLVYGAGCLIRGVFGSAAVLPNQRSKTAWIAIGLIVIAAALTVPGSINWMMASARDANLFS